MPIPSTKRVLITGGQGQLALSLACMRAQASVMGLELLLASKDTLDITNPSKIAYFLDTHPVDALINTAAYTQVDLAENHAEQAWQTNALAPGYLAQACRQRRIQLLHVSSDYVFDGSKRLPWTEEDAAQPLNVYGRSKLAGEQAVLSAMPDALIVRTSWLFSQFGRNFLKTIMGMAQNQTELRIVADQYGGPTYAPHLALALLKIIQRHFSTSGIPAGIYHFAGSPCVSWHDFAQEILSQACFKGLLQAQPQLTAIASSDYLTAAVRPKYSCMNQDKLTAVMGELQNDWRIGVALSLSTYG